MWPRYLVYLCLGKKLKNEIAYAFNFCFYSQIHNGTNNLSYPVLVGGQFNTNSCFGIEWLSIVSAVLMLSVRSGRRNWNFWQSQASSVSNLYPELNYSSGFLLKSLFRLRLREKEISGSRVSKL